MTFLDFLAQCQELYGAYPEDSKLGDFVMAYLRRDIDPNRLPKLFRYLTYSHPVNFGPPDIAAIENAIIWAMKNDKGSDVHRSMADQERGDLQGRIDTLTDDEREQGARMLDERGGMSGMLEGIVHHTDPDEDVERREPYVD